MQEKEIKIVCFGDSLTYGYGVLDQIAFPYRLSQDLPKRYPNHTFTVINSGINGQTTREALQRLQGSILGRKPQIVFILFGSNDCALNEGQYRTPYEYEQNYRQILDRILSLTTQHAFHSEKTLPILLTPPSMVDTDFYPFTTNERLEAYGQIVQNLAKEYELPCIDLFAQYKKIENPKQYEDCFQFDGIHLSNQGYEVLYTCLQETLFAILDDFCH